MLPSVAFFPVLQQPDRLSRRRPQPRPRTSGGRAQTRRAKKWARDARTTQAAGARATFICVRDARRRAVPLDLYLVVHVERDEVQAAAPCAS